jgi:hypothetical protein
MLPLYKAVLNMYLPRRTPTLYSNPSNPSTLSQPFQTGTADISKVQEQLGHIASAEPAKTILESAAIGVYEATREHFKARGHEPRNNTGFPAFGQAFPSRHFWRNNVERKMNHPVIDGDTAKIKIDSPALAHKANPNPPPIRPSKQFLAIPANVRAASWDGTPYGAKNIGIFLRPTKNEKGQKRNDRRLQSFGGPAWWLVRSVRTRHDPRALPEDATLQAAAERDAENALKSIIAGGK